MLSDESLGGEHVEWEFTPHVPSADFDARALRFRSALGLLVDMHSVHRQPVCQEIGWASRAYSCPTDDPGSHGEYGRRHGRVRAEPNDIILTCSSQLPTWIVCLSYLWVGQNPEQKQD